MPGNTTNTVSKPEWEPVKAETAPKETKAQEAKPKPETEVPKASQNSDDNEKKQIYDQRLKTTQIFFIKFKDILNDEKLRQNPEDAIEGLNETRIFITLGDYEYKFKEYIKYMLKHLKTATSWYKLNSTKNKAKDSCKACIDFIGTILEELFISAPDFHYSENIKLWTEELKKNC